MSHALTYWHTVRHLRGSQFYNRVWRQVYRPPIDRSPVPPLNASPGTGWVNPAERRPSLIAADRFEFLHERHSLADHGWDDPSLSKLWRYNLHYFDDLNAQGAHGRAAWHAALLRRWVAENPPAAGTGWEPYPTSLRVVNWIKWAMSGNRLPEECTHSLAVQTRWLSRRLEFHLLGNHLFANAKALIFAGVYFEGPEADRWLTAGLRILGREIPEQILPDGGQFERSPMYHALALEDMLDLCNVARDARHAVFADEPGLGAGWLARVNAMRAWLTAMCHPDGEISFFNDAAIGIAPSPSVLEAYAARLGCGSPGATRDGLTHLVESGYIRLQRDAMVALLDVAPIGPDYLPGHAHADTLSFELTLAGQRVVVNTGTSCYGSGGERLRQRGTAAHSTVIVDGQNSSEVWGGFRVARRARPIGLEIEESDDTIVRCGHDGYKRLAGRPLPLREWKSGAGHLVINDTITGRFEHAEARFHLHPSIVVAAVTDSEIDLRLDAGRPVRISVRGGALRRDPATWHPEFGMSQPTSCLVAVFGGPALQTCFTWA